MNTLGSIKTYLSNMPVFNMMNIIDSCANRLFSKGLAKAHGYAVFTLAIFSNFALGKSHRKSLLVLTMRDI